MHFLLFYMMCILSLSNSQLMTQRFPLACRSPRYNNPFTFTNPNFSQQSVCFSLQTNDCQNNPKCSLLQANTRKVMFASRQIPECGAKQIPGNTGSSRTPFSAWFTNKQGQRVDGLTNVWFHHTYQGTQTAFEIYKGGVFKLPQDDTLDGYTLCISHPTSNQTILQCLVDDLGRIRLSTYDVSDHTCDLQSNFIPISSPFVVVTSPPPSKTHPPPFETSPPPLKISPPHPFETSPPPLKISPPHPFETSPSPLKTSPPPIKTSPPPLKISPPPIKTSPPPLKTSPPPLKTSPPPLKTSPPPFETSQPPLDTSICPPFGISPSFLRISIKYPSLNTTHVKIILCPILQSIFNNTCYMQGSSTTGIYYGMRICVSFTYIRNILQNSIAQFTSNTQLACASTITIYRDDDVLLRYIADNKMCTSIMN